VVRKMAEALDQEGIEHKPRFTKKRRWLRDFRLVWTAEDPLTPSAMSHALTVCARAVQVDFRGICSIVYWGPVDIRYWPREDDPVGTPRSYRLGYAVGNSFGRLLRWLLGKNRA
jgi:hypothetical protein